MCYSNKLNRNMGSVNVIKEIFDFCTKKHIEFELNLEEGIDNLEYDSDKKKVTLYLSDQRDSKTEEYFNSEFTKLKELIN